MQNFVYRNQKLVLLNLFPIPIFTLARLKPSFVYHNHNSPQQKCHATFLYISFCDTQPQSSDEEAIEPNNQDEEEFSDETQPKQQVRPKNYVPKG